MKALGLDIGSSSVKGAVLDLQTGTVRAPVTRPFPAAIGGLPGGWVEIDPWVVCAHVDELLSILIAQAPDAEGVFVSGQMGGVILLDEHVQPLTNYLSWRDQRTLSATPSGDSFLDHVRTRWETADCLANLGKELQPGSTTALLAWLSAQGSLPRGAVPTTVADFVIARLVGHLVPMHATHAIGMIDLRYDAWHSPALNLLGLEDLRMPELAMTEKCVGSAALAGRSIQIFGSYGDQQCALRGAGLQRGELSLNISTGSQVSRRVRKFQPGNYQTRKYFFGDYLDSVTHLPAGRSLNVLVDLLTELARAENASLQNPWETIRRKVEEVADTDLEVDLAFFRSSVGERGRIDHITTENLSVGTLFHAAYRAMADNYASVAARFSPADWTAVILSGGMTQSAPRLKSMLQQRFEAPLRESNNEETLLGLLDVACTTLK